MAQSIGGGGGAVLGGVPNATSLFGSLQSSGNGGDVTVTAGNPFPVVTTITTTGQGAVAVLAQSIGGGGGSAGDLGLTPQTVASTNSSAGVGGGGAVTVTEYGDTYLRTQGNSAPVIMAQSIGGGGGRVVDSSGAYYGSFGGSGSGGPVTVNISGAVTASGVASPGIFAESTGGGAPSYIATGSPITINVNTGANVSGGSDSQPGAGDGAAIYLVGAVAPIQTSSPSSQARLSNRAGTFLAP